MDVWKEKKACELLEMAEKKVKTDIVAGNIIDEPSVKDDIAVKEGNHLKKVKDGKNLNEAKDKIVHPKSLDASPDDAVSELQTAMDIDDAS